MTSGMNKTRQHSPTPFQASARAIFPEVGEPLSLMELLRRRALYQPDDLAYTFLEDEGREVSLTYGELDRQARAIGATLEGAGAAGERVLLLYPAGLEYVAAYFGCIYAGALAVPIYPPRANRNLLRIQNIVADAQATAALTTGQTLARIEPLLTHAPALNGLKWLLSDSISDDAAQSCREPQLSGDTLALLQYTSGSTSVPRGVMVSHANLLHNERMIRRAFLQTERTVIVSWLPLYHDMGLIGGVLQPLYTGSTCFLMSPAAFLQRPVRWLQAITRYGATCSGGPNFAYDLCVRRISEQERAALDLSRWTVAFNGSEPIRAETLERFATAFEPYGFRRDAFYPCYGLAEATLIVSGERTMPQPITKLFEAKALENNRVVEAQPGNEDARLLVGSGAALPCEEVIIVDPASLTQCPPGYVGEIWVSGPSIAQGYWNRPEESVRTFRAHLLDTGEGPFLRTGDLGFCHDGQLFITGRLKDLIIIRGLNHYPQDIELTVESCHPALRPGCGAAFSVEVARHERLVVVQEVDSHQDLDMGELIDSIRQAIAEDHEIQPYAIVLIRRGSIPKTSSGKIQRHACRKGFLDKGLKVVWLWREDQVLKDASEVISPASPPEGHDDIEAWLVSQLSARLGIDPSRIDVTRPISRYGLDSLMAIELVYAIETTLGAALPMTSLLEGQSIAEVAAQISLCPKPAPIKNDADRAEGAGYGYEYPLSWGQQALWFLQELAPSSAAYNIASAARIRGRLEVAALERAFQSLVDRHRCLRTGFAVIQGQVVQRVSEQAEMCFLYEDASDWPEAFLNDRLIKEAHTPFDLREGPLMQINLFARSHEAHVVLLVVHHIIADFWSMSVLLDELAVLYSAEKNGARAALPPLEVGYQDYVRWQEEMLASQEGERHWAYWQKQLAGDLPYLNLHTDRPRPPAQTFNGASESFNLSEEIFGRLKELAANNSATLYMVLLAAFQTLLHRYTGQRDILVGSVTAGRKHASLNRIVGYFVNPIVLRADFCAAQTFTELLKQVRQTVLSAFAHQDYPFGLLVERLQPMRDQSRSPLFQAMFMLQKTTLFDNQDLAPFALGEAGAELRLGELELESVALRQKVAQFDLTLMMADSQSRLQASLQYNTDLFEEATIQRLILNFQALLEDIVANPQKPLSELSIISTIEHRRLLSEWNDTAKEYPRHLRIQELFQAQVEQSHDAVAAACRAEQVSFAQLNARANRLAHYLRSLGVRPDARIGICVERSLEMITAMLGVLKAGTAYVPLDSTYPPERLAFILEDAQVAVLLTEQRLIERFAGSSASIICIDTQQAEIARQMETNPVWAIESGNLAYVIYTSGSTGRPKGAMVTHRNLINFFAAIDELIGSGSPGVWLAVTSIAFDISVLELLWTLARGFQVIISPEQRAGDAAAEACNRAATHLQCTPSLAKLLSSDQEMRQVISGLEKLLLGGEALPSSLALEMREQVAGEFFNMYGPTETTVWSAADRVSKDASRISIGCPITNTQIFLLDDRLQLLPAGVPGEICIGGEGVVRGYLNRPDLTADKFIPNPFSKEDGARLYRTGDLGRHMSDGRIEFLGRLDYQVKIRGFRIELGDVEAVLTTHPSIKEAVVALEGAADDKRLVAYLVTDGPEPIAAAEVRSFLKDRLPECMIPNSFVVLEGMPLTPNGKVDRKALAATDQKESNQPRVSVPPRNAVEEVLASIWSEVLKVDELGVEDKFFDLGGHSLLASQVIYRVRETFEIDFSLRDFFTTPTVSGLASAILRDPDRRAKAERIAELIVSVSRLSDEEAEAMLSESGNLSSGGQAG